VTKLETSFVERSFGREYFNKIIFKIKVTREKMHTKPGYAILDTFLPFEKKYNKLKISHEL
jgi:hypothetical protein